MSTAFTQLDSLSLATVTTTNLDICKAYISIDLHETNNVADQAVFLVLGELLLSGTKTQSRKELLHAVNALGADISITVTDGWLTLVITGHKKVWTKLVTILTTVMTDSVFSAQELKRVKELAKNALHDHKENARTIAVENLRNQFYQQTDRRSTTSINKLQEAVSKLSSKDVKSVYRRVFKRQWLVSVASSHKDENKLVVALEKITSNKPHEQHIPSASIKTTAAASLVSVDIPSKQNIELSIGFPLTIAKSDPEYVALLFGIAVLCKWGGFAGRLMSTVREKEGLTYSIYGRIEGSETDIPGYFRIMTFFNPEQVEQGLTSTFREIKQLHKKGITDTELQSFKTILHTQTILRKDSPLRELDTVHTYHRLGYDLTEIETYEATFQTVTKSEVNTALKKHLLPANLTVSIAGPTKHVKKSLQAILDKVV